MLNCWRKGKTSGLYLNLGKHDAKNQFPKGGCSGQGGCSGYLSWILGVSGNPETPVLGGYARPPPSQLGGAREATLEDYRVS